MHHTLGQVLVKWEKIEYHWRTVNRIEQRVEVLLTLVNMKKASAAKIVLY